jgi:RNA polymerase sigma factor for flagellar operon FliA
MNRKIVTLNHGTARAGNENQPLEPGPFAKMISDHFPLIERQCFRAIRQQLKGSGEPDKLANLENEALELCNHVLDTLRRDNYRVLRQFKGNAKLSTYITTIISRQAVDILRKKLGRSREKERAQKFGKTGMLVYERIIQQGGAVSDVYKELNASGEAGQTMDDIAAIVEKIKGKKHLPPSKEDDNTLVRDGFSVSVDGKGHGERQVIIPDTRGDPQELAMEQQRTGNIRRAVQAVIARLDNDERMILRMRFPAEEDEKPQKVECIATLLGISQKAVYKRIDRLMKKCRGILAEQGMTCDELL